MEFLLLVGGLWGLWVLFKQRRGPSSPPTSFTPPPLETDLPAAVVAREYASFRQRLLSGELCEHFPSSLFLQPGEKLVVDVPGVTFSEFEAGEAMDRGTLTLTTQRFAFRGERRAIEVPLKALNSVEAGPEGFSISRAGKSAVEYFLGLHGFTATLMVTPEAGESFPTQTLEYLFTGAEAKALLVALRAPSTGEA